MAGRLLVEIDRARLAAGPGALRAALRAAPGRRVKVVFTGEPMEEAAALRAAISRLRSARPAFEIEVVTAGAALSPDWIGFFARARAEISVNLDWRRRVPAALPSPVLAAALRDRALRDNFHAVAFLGPATAGRLPEIVSFLRHKAGFKQAEIVFDREARWSRAALGSLRRALGRLRRGGAAALGDFVFCLAGHGGRRAADPAFSSFFAAEVAPLAAQQLAWQRLFLDPGFGDFPHRPKYKGPRPAVRLRLEPPASPARARAALDYALYSPAGAVLAELAVPGLPAPGSPEAAALLYFLSKAAVLGKKAAVHLDLRARV